MSWSISLIGKSENITKALIEQSTKFDGQTKIEFDSALPFLAGIVNENFGNTNQVLKLDASGHGYSVNGEQKDRTLTVSLSAFYGTIV